MIRALILLLIAALTAVGGDNDCIPRVVGPNAIVCVCNSTYCDFPSDVEVQGNQYVYYTSTESGKRLQSSVANFTSNPMISDILFTVDSSVEYQTIFGFGGAMTDAAAINIRTLSNGTQQKLIESYYGNKGSKYTFCRIPIAGTDFSTRPYTYDDTPGDVTLSNFNLVEEDNYKINYLHQIKDVMPNPDSLKIFATAWSAPAWMKDTDDIKRGSLKEEYYQTYADYTRKFFDAYKERGIDIWGMTPGNEPLNGLIPFFFFNSMYWSPTTEANFSANFLAPTLSKAGYNPVYMAMDDQRWEIPWYPDGVFKNEKANKMFSGTAYHWYTNYFSASRLTDLHNQYPDKFILMTEACTGSNLFEREKVKLGSWVRGEEYILDIIENLTHWVVGWVDWNLALDKHGAPNWAKNYVDAPIIVMPEYDEFYKQPMYYALYHVSRFVPPNSKRISLSFEAPNKVKAVAFMTPVKDIVVVLVNTANKPYSITIQNKIAQLATDNLIHLQLPEKSFTTLQYKASQ